MRRQMKMTTEKMLEIRDLSVIYKTEEDDVHAVNHVDLDVYAG